MSRLHRLQVIAPVLAAALATGCASVGDLTGAVAGVATGAVTANPALAAGAAIGVAAATDAGTKYVMRNWHQAEQDSIAATIGAMPVDEQHRWEIRHPLPYANEHGWVRVVRVIRTPLAQCREALFSVDDDNKQQRAWFLVTACRQPSGWKWAVAEPAVPRWGNLQ
ncbi:hypothetical protein OR16_15787 [Cupriavidus basilensis OR16]|uniref:Lipoprotein n=1 Tax=Cupriavidus basilensis OR16 TaxID=1127483 RepID=H1S5M0_9BURK|nr:hypothetical protein [Cupriavidus basilensis]EHP42102.1 hypothetical protein OR16_15787 [Cupriavidus basilensis OR16]